MPGDLETLARLYDVRTAYVDANGRTRHAKPETLRAVLAALGAEVDDPAGAVRAELLRRHVQPLEPVTAVPALGTQAVAASLPRSLHPRDCWMVLEGEDGVEQRGRLMPSIQRPLGSSNLEGRPMERYEVLLSTPLKMLAPGYYRLRLEAPGVDATALVVVAPRCPLPDRGWGAFLPLHAMRTRADWGVGSYTALRELSRWTAGRGGAFVATLPLYPLLVDDGSAAAPASGSTAGRRPSEVSPYLPATRLGWSELYVDPTVLPEFDASDEARQLLSSDAFVAEVEAARTAPLVDYPASASLVRRALEPMSRALFDGASARREGLEAFARAHPELVAYARFRADGVVPAAGDPTAGGPPLPEDEAARYHLYAQFVADEQLAAAGGGLFLDLPVGVHPDGFDTRFDAGAFAHGVEGGAPPDRFYAGGQRWAFRPLHPRAIREQAYRHVVSLLRHAMRHADVLRIDHVMGLYRLWWVPDGAEASDGAYVGYQNEELRAIVSLEAQRSRTAVVGEDLGTVPEEVRGGMAADRMLRSWVLEFEVSPERPLPDPPELSTASIATHDLPRFVTFFESPERARWRRAIGADARRALRACLDHLAKSPARLVLLDLEDLWLERWPHNRPGTGAEAGNWRHRSARALEDVMDDERVADALGRLDDLRRQEVAE
jgi:4-alpha-glucanotransferase